MFCNNTEIPEGAKVRIVNNVGNKCEPFLNLIGTATQPFRTGTQKPGWIGVVLDSDTIYGKKFNFHLKEIELVS
jgi:hypothetical protein